MIPPQGHGTSAHRLGRRAAPGHWRKRSQMATLLLDFSEAGVRQDFYTWSSLCPGQMARIFISCGCCNKVPQPGWLQTRNACSLTVLVARSSRLTCQQGPTPSKASAGGSFLGSSGFWWVPVSPGIPCLVAASSPCLPPCGMAHLHGHFFFTWPSLHLRPKFLFSKDPSLQMRAALIHCDLILT